MDCTPHSTANIGISEDHSDSKSLRVPLQRHQRHGFRGWLAIATLIGVTFASYGALFYLFDTYVKDGSEAIVSTQR